MSFETIYIDMLFESHLRKLINRLLIEAKADVLQARHPDIDVHALAAVDPSPTKKYLDWMVKVVNNGETNDLEELDSLIKQFDSVVQRLQGSQRDINTYKSLSDLQAVLSDVGTTSKTKQKQSAKTTGSQHVGNVDGWDVYFITSHEAAQLLGKGTKWCITQEDGRHWDDYISKVKFFYALRGSPQGDPLDKIAYACYLNTDQMEVFNAVDKSISVNRKSIIELTNFINEIKSQYSDYTATGKNLTMPFFNNKLHGIAKYSNGTTEHYANGALHREEGPAVELASGTKEWWLNGKRHRKDGPAVELASGTKEWWVNGKLHRKDGPAVEKANGIKEWWLNGKRHREDGPASESPNGDHWYLNGVLHREGGPAVANRNGIKMWYLNGKLHREDGPASESPNGDKEWYKNGELHREDGPAIEFDNGTRKWFKNNERHRIDGPAVEWDDGSKEWWLHGQRYHTEASYKKALKTFGIKTL